MESHDLTQIVEGCLARERTWCKTDHICPRPPTPMKWNSKIFPVCTLIAKCVLKLYHNLLTKRQLWALLRQVLCDFCAHCICQLEEESRNGQALFLGIKTSFALKKHDVPKLTDMYKILWQLFKYSCHTYILKLFRHYLKEVPWIIKWRKMTFHLGSLPKKCMGR